MPVQLGARTIAWRLVKITLAFIPLAGLGFLLSLSPSQALRPPPPALNGASTDLEYLTPAGTTSRESWSVRFNDIPVRIEKVCTRTSVAGSLDRQLMHLLARGWTNATDEVTSKLLEGSRQIDTPKIAQLIIPQMGQWMKIVVKGSQVGNLFGLPSKDGSAVQFFTAEVSVEEMLSVLSSPTRNVNIPGLPLPPAAQSIVHLEGMPGMCRHMVVFEVLSSPDALRFWQVERMAELGWKGHGMSTRAPVNMMIFTRGPETCLFSISKPDKGPGSRVLIMMQ